ncbi:alpha-1,3-mannosyl-glycoprotein 4-beta-N-acetylglucosaminyltransferase B-like [Teleopsis dalmanni]|uniref:alpha-1,3-mannosyl-glycoprotein 4-beta-N-acetylglucosaminyltransferase B-like n=1 Tax=Teleopsis dalmanni TaxID=139649 RepID=UPI0018CD86D1|nr:alpha-1,3-mannosyl-glycoprotein 4-beta-N-acetylglucosaminyltransferase B-like [Teleopsis dalmanni]
MRFRERIFLRMVVVAVVVFVTSICALMYHNSSNNVDKEVLNLRLPISFKFLPYLPEDPIVWQPVYIISHHNEEVSFVLGFILTPGNKEIELLNKLKDLLTNMNEMEQKASLIVIFVADINLNRAIASVRLLNTFFSPYTRNGTIDIIAPPPQYYPKELQKSYKDFTDIENWSKQNLDIAYLMGYVSVKGKYYIHLDDNTVSRKNFISTIIAIMDKEHFNEKKWFWLDFCNDDFIGKLFKTSDLPYLATYFQLFYKDKPVHLLLYKYLETKLCSDNMSDKLCNFLIAQLWSHEHILLFEKGAVKPAMIFDKRTSDNNHTTDKRIGFHKHHKNPTAYTKTSIGTIHGYTMKLAYSGESYFHGGIPRKNDNIIFQFVKPTELTRYIFRSGTVKHPDERFYDTTVEILPLPMRDRIFDTTLAQRYNVTRDGFYIVGSFNDDGIAVGTIDPNFGVLERLRLWVHSTSRHWVYLTDIYLEQKNDSELLLR